MKKEILEAIDDPQDDVTHGFDQLRWEMSSVNALVDEILHEILQLRQDHEEARAAAADYQKDGAE